MFGIKSIIFIASDYERKYYVLGCLSLPVILSIGHRHALKKV